MRNVILNLCFLCGVILQVVACAENSGYAVHHNNNEERVYSSRRDNLVISKKSRPSYTLEDLTDKYKNVLESALKPLLPLALKAGSEAKLSTKCTQAIYRVVIGFRQLQQWAISLVDATGKLHSGIFDGTASDLGDYDECVSSTAHRENLQGQTEEAFTGQYCLLQFLPPPLLRHKNVKLGSSSNYTLYEELEESDTIFRKLLDINVGKKSLSTRFGICIPSTCSKEDLRKAMEILMRSLEIEVNVINCVTKTAKNFGSVHVGFVTIVGVLFVMVSAGTVMDIVVRRRKFLLSTTTPQNDYCLRFWRSLSVLKATQNLIKISDNKDEMFSHMKGMRIITVLWIVLANCYFLPNVGFFYQLRRLVSPVDYQNDIFFGLLSNTSPAIDTLFFMSGMLISYSAGRRFVFLGEELQLWKLFGRKFLRFLLPVIFTIWIFLLFPSIGEGPQWIDLVTKNVDVCKTTCWRSFLFIQNFWNYNENCMVHTWVISLMVQYSFISIMLVSMLYKKPAFGVFFNVVVVIAAACATGYVNMMNKFPPNLSLAVFDIELYEKIMNKDNLRTYTHIGPFCIGLLAGYFLLKRQKVRFHWGVLFAGWILCCFIFSTVIYGLHKFPYQGEMYTTFSAIYSSSHRVGWSIALSWICVICATKHGGIVNDILSWRFFVQVDRLSYFIYLLHPLVIYYFAGRARERMSFGHAEMILNFLGILSLTLILSFVAYLFFYFPLKHVDTFLFSRKKLKERDEDRDSHVPDTEAVISHFKSEGAISRKTSIAASAATNGECSGVQVDAYLRKKRNSSVVFKDQPEILSEDHFVSQRKGSETTPHSPRKKKSSLKTETDAQAIKNSLMGEESTIKEESVQNTGKQNEGDDDVFVSKNKHTKKTRA